MALTDTVVRFAKASKPSGDKHYDAADSTFTSNPMGCGIATHKSVTTSLRGGKARLEEDLAHIN